MGPDLLALLDRLAELTADPETAADVRDLYPDERLRVPAEVRNADLGRVEPVIPIA